MEEKINIRPFNKRAFISAAMTASVLILPVSGYMNHSLQFEALTRARHFWMSVHNVSGILFILFALAHIILNRRALLNYLKQKGQYIISKESLTALALITGFIFFIASHAFHVG
jgi:hypothetical protein